MALLVQDLVAAGYRSQCYADSLAEFGRPLLLERSGGYLLSRAIANSGERDATGCYPIFACHDWSALAEDLAEISDLVSVVVVTDPFGEWDLRLLQTCFPDWVRRYKAHYVIDLERNPASCMSSHHRYYARRALRQLHVERCQIDRDMADVWWELYRCLIERHALSGVQAFSRDSFEKQLRTPGMVMLRAQEGSETVAAHLWLIDGDVAYSHLTAANARGYELMATYALHAFALEEFDGVVRYLDLGGGASIDGSTGDGLATFKGGWANETRPVYICGRIIEPEKYEQLCCETSGSASSYFPPYRACELS